MTNKFRRSMASVLLAASLLFSSQSVVAFADYGSKSDASDLSPVQESVETVVKDEQTTVSPEEPAKNGEEGEQEKTETPEKPAEGEGEEQEEQEKPEEKPAEGEGEEQDKPETQTPETPADPSVVAPTPLDPATPVEPVNEAIAGYGVQANGLNGYEKYTDSFVAGDCELKIYSNASKVTFQIDHADSGSSENSNIELVEWNNHDILFPNKPGFFSPGIGYRVFYVKDTGGWVFNNWETHISCRDLSDTNASDVDNSAFEFNGNELTINRLTGLWEIVGGPKSYYSAKANFDPLVGVVYDSEEGTVSSDLEPYTKQEGYQYKATYGNPATFTIKPIKAGYKPLVNGNECADNGDGTYTYTIENVTEPTTLEVTFEEDSTIPSIPEPDNSNIEDFIVTVKCDKDHSSPFNPLHVSGAYKVADKNPDLRISWISVNHEVLCDEFSKVYGNHTLLDNDSKWTPIELKWDDQGKEWKLSDSNQKNIILNVKCTSEISEPDKSIISQLEVALNCVNVTDGSHNDTSKLSTFTTGYYTCTVDQEKQTATVRIDDTQAKYWIDNNINTMVGKEQHSFVSVSDPITLTYENGQWKVPEDDNAKKIVIKMLCGPSIAQLNDQLNVKMVCVNDDAKHQKTASFDNLLDYSFDVTNLKNDNSAVTAEVVVKPSPYLDKFYNISGGIEHSVVIDNETYPVNEDGSVTVRFSYTGEWNLLDPTRNMVTFPVECTTEKPVTPPTENQVKALFKSLVNVKCSTNTNHSSLNYDITEFDIGDAWAVVPQNNSETPSVSFVDVTINQTATYFFNQYNSDTGHASTSYSGSVPASIRLMFNNETEQWEIYSPTGTINLTVTCSTGGTITPTPGGNGGNNDDDDDRYTGDNTVTRTINDDDVPLNDRPTNTTTIDDEDVPLADLPDDTVTIDDGEVPLKDNPSTGDSLPFAAMAAAVLSLGGVIVLNRKKK